MTGTRPRWALGAMSGTSLDGVDAALVLTDGVRLFEFGETGYRPYRPEERKVIRAALGAKRDPNIDEEAAEVVETARGHYLADLLPVVLVQRIAFFVRPRHVFKNSVRRSTGW